MVMSQNLSKIQLFLPVSTKIIAWYLFVIAYVLTDLIMTIIVHCFHHPTTKKFLFDVVNNLLPMILIIDILISLNTGYIKNGKIILDRKKANYEYFMTIYFWCDIIALVLSLFQIIFQNTFLKEITIFSYLIFIKLTTAYYTDSLLRKYVIKSFTGSLYYQVAKNFLILAILCHIIGSFYFYIDILMYDNGWYQAPQLWIFSSYAYSNIHGQDFWIQYTYSYYVACVTLSGTAYGDILPLNPYENIYIFCCFVFPMLIYSYVYSSIFTALFNRKSTSAQIRRYKFLVKQYLKSLGVTAKTMNKILTYLEFIYRKNMIVDINFINDLAPTIKNQFLHKSIQGNFSYNCFQYILQIAKLNQNYLKDNIFKIIKQEYFPERFSLLSTQKLKVFYLNSGAVVEVVSLQHQRKLSKPIKKYSHFAKTAFFTNQISVQKLAFQSNSFAVCHTIDYQQFRKVAKQKMPTINEAFCLVQSKLLDEKLYQKMNQRCYFCDQITHTFSKCPHLSPNRQSMLQQRQNYQQQRNFFNRDQKLKKSKLLKKQSMFIKFSSQKNQSYSNKNKRSKKIYLSSSKKVQNDVFGQFLDKQFYQYLSQFNIKQKNYLQQTQENCAAIQEYIKQKISLKNSFQKICFWDNYYPQFNL